MVGLFVVTIDGKAASMTNDFDSAAFHAEHLKKGGHRVTIRALLPPDVEPELDSLLFENHQGKRLSHELLRPPRHLTHRPLHP